MSCFSCAKRNIEREKKENDEARKSRRPPKPSEFRCNPRDSDITTGLTFLTCYKCSENFMRGRKCLMCLVGDVDNFSAGVSGDPFCRKCHDRKNTVAPDKFICNICGMRTKSDARYATCDVCFGLCLSSKICPVCRIQYKSGVKVAAATRQGFVILCEGCADVTKPSCTYCFGNKRAPNSNTMCQRCVELYEGARQ